MLEFKFVFDNLTNDKDIIKKLFKEYKRHKILYEENIDNDIKESYKLYKDYYNIILTSPFQVLLYSKFLNNYGYINNKTFNKHKKYFRKYSKYYDNYLYVLLTSNDHINLNINHKEECEEYLIKHLIKCYENYDVNYLIINVDNKNDIKLLNNIIKKIYFI